jgi:hypothetical protein
MELEMEFLKIAIRILEKYGFQESNRQDRLQGKFFDAVVQKDNVNIYVELKAYTTKVAYNKMLEMASRQMEITKRVKNLKIYYKKK